MKSTFVFCILPALAAAADFYPESLLCKINNYRADRKLPALGLEPKLVNSTQGHCKYMAKVGRLTRYELDGNDAAARARAAGYKYRTIGEIIGAGYRTFDEFLESLIRNADYRQYLESTDFEMFGAAMAYGDDDDMPYWAVDFGSSFREPGNYPKCGSSGSWLEEPNKPPTSAQASGIIKADRE